MSIKKAIVGSIIVVLGGVLLVPSVEATSSFHFPTDTLAITKKQGTTTSIWKADIYGHRIDADSLYLGKGAHSSAWSPDGRKLAYVKNDQLYVASKNSEGRQLLHSPKGYQDSYPVWSPDGSKLVFVRTANDGRQAIYTATLHGAKTTNVSGWSDDTSYRSPSWSPQGDKLVYEQYSDSAARLLIKTLKTGDQTILTELSDVTTSSDVSWSPSGKKILYKDSSNETYTIWPDGSHRSVISDGDSYQASWSPSGDRIVFLEDPGDVSLSISEKDGTVVWLPIQKGNYAELANPTWSSDEDKIAFTMARTEGGRRSEDLFVLDLKGDTVQPLRVMKNVIGRADWR